VDAPCDAPCFLRRTVLSLARTRVVRLPLSFFLLRIETTDVPRYVSDVEQQHEHGRCTP